MATILPMQIQHYNEMPLEKLVMKYRELNRENREEDKGEIDFLALLLSKRLNIKFN